MSKGKNRFIHADLSRCLSCKSCELACGLAHAGYEIEGAAAGQMKLKPRVSVVQQGTTVALTQCRQCEDAPCVKVCPNGSLYQEEGLVKLNRETCIGCKLCARACPFGSITMTTEMVERADGKKINRTKALKCDLCFSRNKEIKAEGCACIQACPTKVLSLSL